MEDFIKQLLQDKGVSDSLPEDIYNQLASDLTARATAVVNKQIIESMTPDLLEQFEAMLDSQPDNAGAMREFIDKNISDKEQITVRALAEFRALYLGEKV